MRGNWRLGSAFREDRDAPRRVELRTRRDALSSPPTLMSASRALLAASRALRAPALPRRASSVVCARWASSTPVQGNPDIINTLPNTADEVKVEVPPESVPSSAGLDSPLVVDNAATSLGGPTDWSRSYHGLSSTPFPKEVAEVLLQPIDAHDVEIKPGRLSPARIITRLFD